MVLMRILKRWWLGRLAFVGIGSALVTTGLACCGGVPARVKHPTIRLTSSNFSHHRTISTSETLTVTATTTTPTSECAPYARINDGKNRSKDYKLYDDGSHGDQTPGDGIWHLDLPWKKTDIAEGAVEIRIVLEFEDSFQYQPEYGAQVRIRAGDRKPGEQAPGDGQDATSSDEDVQPSEIEPERTEGRELIST